ncbi:MAG: hypothetical protein WD009_08160 [Phycisphaeraceae bacterium]
MLKATRPSLGPEMIGSGRSPRIPQVGDKLNGPTLLLRRHPLKRFIELALEFRARFSHGCISEIKCNASSYRPATSGRRTFPL